MGSFSRASKNVKIRRHASSAASASYGGKDRPLKNAAGRLAAALETLGVEHDVKEYPEARHGFLFKHSGATSLSEPLFVAYNAAAADDAWRRIFTFFDARLKESSG